MQVRALVLDAPVQRVRLVHHKAGIILRIHSFEDILTPIVQVMRHASVWKEIKIHGQSMQPLDAALEIRPRAPTVIMAIITRLMQLDRVPPSLLYRFAFLS